MLAAAESELFTRQEEQKKKHLPQLSCMSWRPGQVPSTLRANDQTFFLGARLETGGSISFILAHVHHPFASKRPSLSLSPASNDYLSW